MSRKTANQGRADAPLAWTKWWWDDWDNDPALQACSSAARGNWLDLLSIAAKSTPRGFVMVNGKPASIKQMAAKMRESVEVAEGRIAELEENGVFSRYGQTEESDPITPIIFTLQEIGVLPTSIEHGTIFCRRVIKDMFASLRAKENGGKGGNPALVGRDNAPAPIMTSGDTDGLTGGLTHGLTGGVNPQEARGKKLEAVQASPDAAEDAALNQPPPKAQSSMLPLSDFEILKAEGFPILAKLFGKSLDDPAHRTYIGKTLNKMRSEAALDDIFLLGVLRDCDAKPPREPAAWIRKAIQAKSPRLVVNNDPDPDDPRGIYAWCRALPGVKQTETDRDRLIGKYEYGGFIVDDVAKRVAEAARLPYAWRGDWHLLGEWLNAKLSPDRHILPTIRSMVERFAEPATSLAVFDRAIREKRAA